jgi:hypothetical protein
LNFNLENLEEKMKIEIPKYCEMSSCFYYIYPEMEAFCENINNPNIKATLSIVGVTYYVKGEPQGCMGYQGPFDGNKYGMPKNREILRFTLTVTESWINDNIEKLKKLYSTPGGEIAEGIFRKRDIYNYRQNELRVDTPTIFGIYKKPFFDDVYKILKDNNIVKDEQEMIYFGIDKYQDDSHFTEKREFTTEEGCIKKFSENVTTITKLDTYTLNIDIIVADLEANKECLLSIFNSLE